MIDRSLTNIVVTVDPLAGTYQKLLQDGVDAGTTKQADINGIFDRTALNDVVPTRISAQGLGREQQRETLKHAKAPALGSTLSS